MSETLIRLTALESAISRGIGVDWSEPPLPATEPDRDPLAALERVALRGLQRPPCVVCFSGGRDSSAMLAVATLVARREGLPLPVPSTLLFPEHPDTDEASWQELVIRHLRLPEWNRQSFGTELNLLGPVAQGVIRRHGIIGPAGTHVLVPTFNAAPHGSVLTGIEGDGLLNGGGYARIRSVIGMRSRPRGRDFLTLGKLVAPDALRLARARRTVSAVPWLRHQAAAELRVAIARESLSEPLLWRERVAWFARLRYVIVVRQVLERLAADADVLLLHPLLDPAFLAALAREGGAVGYGDRTETMRALFGELLPAAILERASKVDFTSMFWSGEARRFIEKWDGGGIPESLVDPQALGLEWSGDFPDGRSALLLQCAWAAASGISQRN